MHQKPKIAYTIGEVRTGSDYTDALSLPALNVGVSRLIQMKNINILLEGRLNKLVETTDKVYLSGGNDQGTRPSDGILSSKQFALGATIFAAIASVATHEPNPQDVNVTLSQSTKSVIEKKASIIANSQQEQLIESNQMTSATIDIDTDSNPRPGF